MCSNWYRSWPVDPFTAFQELSMYISGVLGAPEKQTIIIDDKSLATSKGYNKMSFRKEKHQRKSK